jgi:hypothetical protein
MRIHRSLGVESLVALMAAHREHGMTPHDRAGAFSQEDVDQALARLAGAADRVRAEPAEAAD